MKLYKEQIELTSHGKTPSYFDITPQVKEAIAKSGVKEGICTVLTAHTTCSVFFEEFVHDYTDAEVYLPGGDRTQLFNCDAHLKSTILGSSETFEVADGKLGVGTTGYIYFVDFDRTRSRKRKCKIIIMGEEA